MKVDLSCPLELRGYELIADDAGHTRANITLFNLARRRVSAIEAVAHWRSSRTGASAAVPLVLDHLRAAPRDYFRFSLPANAAGPVDELELNFTCVRFEDGQREWRAGSGPVVDIAEVQPLAGREQNALLAAAGEDAVCFAETDGGFWRCVCGRVSPPEARRCLRCGRRREELFPALTRAAVLADAPQVLGLAELDDLPLDERRARRQQAEMLHREYRRTHAALLRRTAAALAAATLLAVIAFFL